MMSGIFSNPYFLSLLSGICLALSFPPFDFSFLAWVALVPLLYALEKVRFEKTGNWGLSFRRAQLAGVLCGIVFYYGTLYWLTSIFGMLALLLISILLLYWVLFGHVLGFLLSRWNNPLALMLVAPPLWVAIEYLKSEGWWLKFSWMNLGYSQHDFLPVLQVASIIGQYGISYLIVLVNSAIVLLIVNRGNRRICAGISLSMLALAGALLLHAFFSLKTSFEPSVRIALVQDESSDFPTYARLTQTVSDDVDIILWPEYAVPEFLEEENDLLDRIRELTLLKDAYLILGAKDKVRTIGSDSRMRMLNRQGVSGEVAENLQFHNTAFLFSPEGDIIGKYYKVNPIQFFADGIAGREFPSFETIFGRIGIIICYDADYSRVARKVVRNGAQLLCIPTYDALSWTPLQHEQHSAMTSMRAVENRRYVARATSSGISQIIDAHGRVATRMEIGESGAAAGRVAMIDKLSFYTRYGYLFPYACIAAAIGFLAACLLPART